MDFIVSLCHFCELHGPKVLICTQSHKKYTINKLHTQPSINSDLNKCQACFPFSDSSNMGFKSYDDLKEIIYISSSNTIYPEFQSIIKQCCIRSISCEQYPGQWGTIYYGCDSENCHVMACKFPLKDFHARGFQQTFCINIVSLNKSELLCNWSFIASKINDIVSWLQHFSKTEFERESILLKQKNQFGKSLAFSSKQSRSLLNITNNENILQELHSKFSYLLKDIYLRYEVKFYEPISGPPVINFKQLEESDGFVKIIENSQLNPALNEDINLNEFKGNLYPRLLYKFLGHSNFEMMLHNILIGNQIIVRCNQKQIIKSVIDCLLNFLPKNCIEYSYFEDSYSESLNLLGLALIYSLPKIQRTCLILDISGNTSLSEIVEDMKENENILYNRHFIITHEKLPYPPKIIPTYLDKIVQFLKNENLDHEVINICLNGLKIEWINKVRSYEKFIAMMNSVSKKDNEKLLQIIGASTIDTDLIQFWKIIK